MKNLISYDYTRLSSRDREEIYEMNLDFIKVQARNFCERTRSQFEFDDVFQEMSIAFIQKLEHFDKTYQPEDHTYKNFEQHFGAFFKRILENHAYDKFVRTTTRKKDLPLGKKINNQIGDEGDKSCDLDIIIGANMTPEQQMRTMVDFDNFENRVSVNNIIAQRLKNEEDLLIICHSFGICGYEELTQEEIGKKLNKAQAAISKKKDMILERLRFSDLRHLL